MSTLYVNYCITTRLPCLNALTPTVFLCVADSALLASPYKFVEAQICQGYNNGDCGSRVVWSYSFSYSSDFLADLTVPLQSSDIVGVFCTDCLTDYIDNKVSTVTATLPITSSGGTTPDISTSMNTGKLIGRGSSGVGEMEEIIIGTNLSLVGTTLNASGGGGGGGCINSVTTAALNALILASGLTPGCFYIITDHVQNRILAGTQITLLATDVNAVTSECSVLTSYDTRPWRGVYDTTTNLLTELADNRGNVCRQYDDGFSPTTCVDDFDWGNPSFTNCLVENSFLTVTYGVSGQFTELKVLGQSSLTMTSYAGTFLYNVEVSNSSQLDITGSTIAIEELIITNGSNVSALTTSIQNPFLIDSIFEYSTLNVPATSYIYIEGSRVSNRSDIQVHIGAGLVLIDSQVSNESQIHVTTVFTGGDLTLFTVQSTSINASSTLTLSTAIAFTVSVIESSIHGGALLWIDNANTVPIAVDTAIVDALGIIKINSGTTTCVNTTVSQGTLFTNGFDVTGVYVKGVIAHTCIGNETNTGYTYISGGSISGLTPPLAIADGGTGSSTAATARTALGLGTIATQNSNAVSITGGSITGITDLAVADGGTGSSTPSGARTNLGVGTLGTQNSNAVTITGGSITGITDLAIADGGTGQSTALAAFTALAAGLVWTDYSGTIAFTNDGVNTLTVNTVNLAVYLQIGKLMFVNIDVDITLSGTPSIAFTVSMPSAAASTFGGGPRPDLTLPSTLLVAATSKFVTTSVLLVRQYDSGTLANGAYTVKIIGMYQLP